MLVFVNHDDLRGQELMEELIRQGYYVTDEWSDLRFCQMIYLGMKGVDCKNHLFLHHETIVVEDSIWKQLQPHTKIFTIVHNRYLEELGKQYHFEYEAFLDDEYFINQNSLLTAEGMLAYLISHRRFPLYHSQVHVLGYGHCGKAIVKALVALQACVHVGVRNNQLFDDIKKAHAKPYCLQDMDLSSCEILINTVPSQIVTPKHLDQAHSHMMILDIASYPYGVDHHYALSKGFNSIILPSIPSKYAYGYAGKMMADQIEREINHE